MLRALIFLLLFAGLMACGDQSNLKDAPVSGFKYKVYTSGDGVLPKIGDYTYFNMEIFDQNDSLLQTFRGQEILPSIRIEEPTNAARKKNPLVDVLTVLSVGDSVGIIVPRDSVPEMGDGYEYVKHLEYRVKVEEIATQEEYQARIQKMRNEQMAQIEALKEELPKIEALTSETLEKYKKGQLQLETTDAGVKYFIHEKGDGEIATANMELSMHYFGRVVSSGQEFDNSYKRGKPYAFRVGARSVIAGWDDIALYLPKGTKASVFIPSSMGYGERGSAPVIGPNEELYFYVTAEELRY